MYILLCEKLGFFHEGPRRRHRLVHVHAQALLARGDAQLAELPGPRAAQRGVRHAEEDRGVRPVGVEPASAAAGEHDAEPSTSRPRGLPCSHTRRHRIAVSALPHTTILLRVRLPRPVSASPGSAPGLVARVPAVVVHRRALLVPGPAHPRGRLDHAPPAPRALRFLPAVSSLGFLPNGTRVPQR